MASKREILYERVPFAEEEVDAVVIQAMQKADVHPAIIHAYQKTGRLVSRENMKYLTKAELKEWNDAVNEWYDEHEE